MDWKKTYLEDRRKVNGIENVLLNAVFQSQEYQEFVSFDPDHEPEIFIADDVNEDGTLEIEVSRLKHFGNIEWIDRLLYRFLPGSIARKESVGNEEKRFNRLMNMDSFQMKEGICSIRAETSCCEIGTKQGIEGSSPVCSELSEEYLKSIYRRKSVALDEMREYYSEREKLIESCLIKQRKQHPIPAAGISLDITKYDNCNIS